MKLGLDIRKLEASTCWAAAGRDDGDESLSPEQPRAITEVSRTAPNSPATTALLDTCVYLLTGGRELTDDYFGDIIL